MAAGRSLLTIALALVAGFAGAALFAWSGLGATIGGNSVREYLLTHPEVLPQAMNELQRREHSARLAPLKDALETPYPGAVLGNPQGSVTLVEFSDYACGYCRSSLADVERLIEENPDLRLVVREYPILAPESTDAARMALAAAEQGRYAEFHDAMFALGPPSSETIEAAARRAGVDLEKAREAIALGRIDGQIEHNMALAQAVGISGTPTWIVGEQALTGAVGAAAIDRAIEAARGT